MKVKPIGDRVVVKVEELSEKTKGGIFIPQAAQEKTQVGSITEVGDGKEISVKVGDVVMYNKYAGTSFSDAGSDYLILKNEDLLAIIKKQ